MAFTAQSAPPITKVVVAGLLSNPKEIILGNIDSRRLSALGHYQTVDRETLAALMTINPFRIENKSPSQFLEYLWSVAEVNALFWLPKGSSLVNVLLRAGSGSVSTFTAQRPAQMNEVFVAEVLSKNIGFFSSLVIPNAGAPQDIRLRHAPIQKRNSNRASFEVYVLESQWSSLAGPNPVKALLQCRYRSLLCQQISAGSNSVLNEGDLVTLPGL